MTIGDLITILIFIIGLCIQHVSLVKHFSERITTTEADTKNMRETISQLQKLVRTLVSSLVMGNNAAKDELHKHV